MTTLGIILLIAFWFFFSVYYMMEWDNESVDKKSFIDTLLFYLSIFPTFICVAIMLILTYIIHRDDKNDN